MHSRRKAITQDWPAPPPRPHLAAKNTQPIRSLDDLAANIFESDEELEEFLAFTYAERHRDTV